MRCAAYRDVVFNRGSVVPLFMIAANATQSGSACGNERARAFGRDMPAALVEDVVAIVGAYLIVAAFP